MHKPIVPGLGSRPGEDPRRGSHARTARRHVGVFERTWSGSPPSNPSRRRVVPGGIPPFPRRSGGPNGDSCAQACRRPRSSREGRRGRSAVPRAASTRLSHTIQRKRQHRHYSRPTCALHRTLNRFGAAQQLAGPARRTADAAAPRAKGIERPSHGRTDGTARRPAEKKLTGRIRIPGTRCGIPHPSGRLSGRPRVRPRRSASPLGCRKEPPTPGWAATQRTISRRSSVEEARSDRSAPRISSGRGEAPARALNPARDSRRRRPTCRWSIPEGPLGHARGGAGWTRPPRRPGRVGRRR